MRSLSDKKHGHDVNAEDGCGEKQFEKKQTEPTIRASGLHTTSTFPGRSRMSVSTLGNYFIGKGERAIASWAVIILV